METNVSYAPDGLLWNIVLIIVHGTLYEGTYVNGDGRTVWLRSEIHQWYMCVWESV